MKTDARQESLLKTIMMYSFVIDEIALYLDTHKTCAEALAYFRKYRDLYNEAVKKYVEEYGPLNYRQSKAEKSWDWTDGKWPWEKED
ncbi:MAG: spore coat protein CotJB [Oscillospiraceae bacterium]